MESAAREPRPDDHDFTYTTIVGDTEADHTRWLDARKSRLGASDMASICGLNPWRTALDVWLEKTGKRDVEHENDAMFLGKVMEPVVAKMFTRKTGITVAKYGACVGRSDLPWAMATPDYVTSHGALEIPELIECKTTAAHKAEEWEDGQVPNAAHIQLIFQMGISGFTNGRVACLIGGRDFVEKGIPFSPDIFGQLVERGEAFMDLVKRDIPPEAMAGDAETLRELRNGEIESTTVQLDEALLKDVLVLLDLQTEQSAAEKTARTLKAEREALQNKFRQILGRNRFGLVGNYKIEHFESPRAGYTVQPSITAKLTVTDTSKPKGKKK